MWIFLDSKGELPVIDIVHHVFDVIKTWRFIMDILFKRYNALTLTHLRFA